MSFNHTNTFLRSALLENPEFIGDLLGPEDVLRIENEYPELFTSAFDLGNLRNKKQTDSSKFPLKGQQLSDRLTRLAESANKNCNREQCKPPQPPPPKTSASDFMQEFKENKNKILKSKLPGPSMRPPPPPPRPTHIPVQSHVAKATQPTISCNNEDNDNFNRSVLPPKVTVSSPSLKYKGKIQQISGGDSQSHDAIKLRKSSSVPVKITKTNNGNPNKAQISGVHPMPMNFVKYISIQDKKNQLVQENLAAAISKFKSQEKQVGFKNTGVKSTSNIPLVTVTAVSASTSALPSPRTPKNDVTLRHALKSKSSGFLNPVPILLTKKSKTLTLSPSPHNSNDINAGSMSIPKPKSTLITGTESHKSVLRLKEQVDQETMKRIYQTIHLRNRFNHLNERLDLDKESTPDLSDILEERETETENDEGANNIGNKIKSDYSQYSDNSNSFSSSTTDSNNEKDQDNNSLINIKSNYQFKDPILQQDRQSYLAQASLNRCEQLLLTRLLASKYEQEGKFRKPDAANMKRIERSSLKDTILDSAAAADVASMQNKRHIESQTRRFELPSFRSTSKSRISKVISKSSSATIVTETTADPDPIPIHDVILTHFVQQNRSFERVLQEKPRLLQEIAHELIYAEVLKILQEEHQLKSNGYYDYDMGRMDKEVKSPLVVHPPPPPQPQPQPVMLNKCVGTMSRPRSSRDKSQQTPIKYSPQTNIISTLASRTNSKSSIQSHPNSNSKILCEVKPLLTRKNSNSPPNSNSEALNGSGSPNACATANYSQMSPGSGSISVKHSSEINSLSLPGRLEEALQNGNSKTNSSREDGDGGGEYTDNFDEEITGTGSSGSVGGSKASKSSDRMLPLKSKSRSVSIHSIGNVNLTKISELESEQKSNQSNNKGNESSRKSDIAKSPHDTRVSGTVSPKPETQEMSNRSELGSENGKPAKSLTPVVEKTKKNKITPPKPKEKEKLDITDCDCSELEEDFIFSETEQSASVQPQPVESPVLKPPPESPKPKSEESNQVVNVGQQLGFSPNSYSGADFASSRADSDLHNTLDPTVPHGDDLPSLQPTEQGPAPAPRSSAGKEEPVVLPSPSTRSRSSRRSVPVKTPQSAASVASRSSHTKVSFSGSVNLHDHSPAGSGLPTASIIQQLLEEAEKLQSEEHNNDVEATSISNSISIPIMGGSENEEKLYKEIIAEMRNHSNSSNNPSSVSVVNENRNDNLTGTGDDLLLNADLFNPTIISQSQDKTDLESSCASILDIISEGELVIEQNSEETSPGEIYNHSNNNFNPNFNFSPGFYSKLLIKR